MRNLRMPALLVMAALAAMSAVASTAAATVFDPDTPDLRFVKEPSPNTPCPAVGISGTTVSGGCLIHANSEAAGVELRKHVFGIESHTTRCVVEFHARVDDHGEGYIFEQDLTNPPGGNCVRHACKNASDQRIPWQFHGYEGTPEATQGTTEGREYLETSHCFAGGGVEEPCEIEIPFQARTTPDHSVELGHSTEMAGHGPEGFRCELVGHWITETGSSTHGTEEEVLITHVNEG